MGASLGAAVCVAAPFSSVAVLDDPDSVDPALGLSSTTGPSSRSQSDAEPDSDPDSTTVAVTFSFVLGLHWLRDLRTIVVGRSAWKASIGSDWISRSGCPGIFSDCSKTQWSAAAL